MWPFCTDCDAELAGRSPWLRRQRSADPGAGRQPGVLSQPVDPSSHSKTIHTHPVGLCEPVCLTAHFLYTGHWELCHHGQNNGSDVAEVRFWPGWNRAAQRRTVHQGPADGAHGQAQQPKGGIYSCRNQSRDLPLAEWSVCLLYLK